MSNAKIITGLFGIWLVSALVYGCNSYNILQNRDEQVKAAESKMLTVYQKRNDLVPNLVETVKAYASHEKGTLTAVTEARASATKTIIDPSKATPEDMQNYLQAQGQLSMALGKLLMVTENYPNLKADVRFGELQTELTNLESQIVAVRNKYTKEVEGYNKAVRRFPANLVAKAFDYNMKPQLSVDDVAAVKKVPVAKFN